MSYRAKRVMFVALAALTCLQPVPSAAADEVVGVGNFSLIVQNIDRALAFYRDGLGFEVTVDRPFDPNPLIMKLGNAIGAQTRFMVLKVPGSDMGVELIEYKDIDRKVQTPRFYDPGAANLALQVRDPGTAILQLRVRDVTALTAKLKAAGATVVTTGGVPVELRPGMKISVVLDPNNLMLELIQSN